MNNIQRIKSEDRKKAIKKIYNFALPTVGLATIAYGALLFIYVLLG